MSARMPSRGDPVLDLAARVAQLERELKEMHARVLTVGARRLIVFTADTTFEKADFAWLRLVRPRVLGAGGAGGGASATDTNQRSAGSGAASGNYAESFLHVDDLPDIVTITVGLGALGATGNGAAGGESAFDTGSISTRVRAGGGGGGSAGNATSSVPSAAIPGVPSTVIDGDIEIRGNYGFYGLADPNSSYAIGGAGAPAPGSLGGGGARNSALRTATSSQGIAAAGLGGGGGGAANGTDETATPGGNGRNGLVVVELFG